MAHYNLYETLGLDRNDSSVNLRSVLESRLAGGIFDNPGGEEEIKLAINVLGDEQKRALYDSRLNDSTADDIDVAALRQLGELNLGGANPSASSDVGSAGIEAGVDQGREHGTNQGAAVRQKLDSGFTSAKQGFASAREGAAKQAHELGAEYRQSSKKAIAVTAIVAAAGGLIVGSFLGGGDGSTLKKEGRAKAVVQEYIEADSIRAVEDWANEYVARDRRDMFESLNGYAVAEDAFDARDLKVGETASTMRYQSMIVKGVRQSFDELAEADKLEDQGVVSILDGNDEVVGFINMKLIDGNWEVYELGSAPEADSLID